MHAPLPQDDRRRSPDQPFGHAIAETRSTRDEARRVCGQERERDRARVPESEERVRSARRVPTGLALPRHGTDRDHAHVCGSTSRIPATGSTRASAAKACPAAHGLPRGCGPGRRTYRDRSTGVAILAQLGQYIVEGRDRPTGRHSTRCKRRRCDPSLSYSVRQQSIARRSTSPGGRRHEFGDDAIAVGHENGFTGSRRPHVFAELILQVLDANNPHFQKVATRGHLFNPPPRRLTPLDGITG